MIRGGKDPVLMDVGVAEITEPKNSIHTRTADFLGTTRYASPQYLAGEGFTENDDIYSLGGVLYHLATGEEIYESVARKPLLAHTIMTTRPKASGKLRADVPEGIGILVDACLSYDRGRRPLINEIMEVLEDPDGAAFVAKEKQLRERDAAGYTIIATQDQGKTLFAVVDSDADEGGSYKVVRDTGIQKGIDRILVQKQIALAELKHIANGIGHFSVQNRRWVPNQSDFMGFPSNGHYTNSDEHKERPREGDRIVRS